MAKRTVKEAEKLIEQVKDALSPEPNFTKGEWSCITLDLKDYKNMTIISESEEVVICRLHLEYGINETSKANARLICAAPDLCEALEELIQVKDWKDKNGKDEHYLKAQPVVWENARKALAKANNI